MRYFLLFLLSFLYTLHSSLMSGAIMGHFFSTDNEISASVVNDVFQDQNGFIWIATGNGLNVYDGYKFSVYKQDNAQGSIGDNVVNCITQAPDTTLYVGTYSGLQYFDHDVFADVTDHDGQGFRGFITALYRTRSGDVIGGASSRPGIFRIYEHGKAVWEYSDNPLLHGVRSILEDPDGDLWLITERNGIVQKHDTSFIARTPQSGMPRGWMSLCCDSAGNIYAGATRGGLYVLNKGEEAFHLIPGTERIICMSLLNMDNGRILMGTDGQGVMKYKSATGCIESSVVYSLEISLETAKIQDMIYDRQGNLWLGMLQKGVFMVPATHSQFSYQGFRLGPHNTIGKAEPSAVFMTADKHLWVSTDGGGLYELDQQGRQLHAFEPPTVPKAIMGMCEDDQHRLWIASWQEGAGWVDRSTGTYHRLPVTSDKNHSTFDIATDGSQYLWIATMGNGLLRVNMRTQETKEYHSDPNKPNSLPNEFVTKLWLSKDKKRLYTVCSVGFTCLDIKADNWAETAEMNREMGRLRLTDVKEDLWGRIWICSSTGLHVFDPRHNVHHVITTAQMLPENNIAAVEIDSKNRAWVSTLHGLACLDAETLHPDNFYVDDGLQGNEFAWRVSCSNDESGDSERLCFGGVYGINWFSPSKIYAFVHKPEIHLISVAMGDSIVKAGAKSGSYTITDKIVFDAERFDFAPEDNDLRLSFSTLTYGNTERISYQYRVNGDNWFHMPRGENTIAFSHLRPGTYMLNVRAFDNGTASDVRTWTIVIHAPWYLSIWAKLLYFLVALLVIYLIFQSIRQRHRNQLRLQEHIHAEELSEQKLRFFMNLSHEIRTPMTLISSPIDQLLQLPHDQAQHSLFLTIRRNANRILALVSEMMDLRKIDQGKMELRFRETDIIPFAQDVVSLFQTQASSKNIELSFTHPDDPLPVWIDGKNFDKVLVNVLSNAFKFTSTGGHISVDIHTEAEHCIITVSDDGESIPEDKLERIFTRFYQARSSTNDRLAGTGIGLDLCRSLVELHHGTIKAHNNTPEPGCAFVIDLPLGKDHLDPESIVETPANDTVASSKESDAAQAQPEPYSVAESPEAIVATEDLEPDSRNTIVVAEDDAEIREYLANQFEPHYHVITCPNGKLALEAVLRNIPQLVISDIMMPEMDGNELCARIKAGINTNHIPVILLTAKSSDEDKLEGLETGADAYIVKPFNIDILQRTVDNLIRARHVMKNKFNGNEGQADRIKDVSLQSPDEQFLDRVMKVINANLSNENLSVDMLSAEVGISRVHLYRKMKELTNQSPHEFIRNLRLKQAANLLSDRHQNITEVMYACGFSNPTSFSTMFRKMYGMSPRQYMQEHENISKD